MRVLSGSGMRDPFGHVVGNEAEAEAQASAYGNEQE